MNWKYALKRKNHAYRTCVYETSFVYKPGHIVYASQSVFQLGLKMEGHDFGKRALQHIKNYEKGQYSYFQLLNIKNVFQHYIFSSLHLHDALFIYILLH